MKQFLKTDSGLDQAARPEIRVFESIEAAEAALANGELGDGEIISTDFIDGRGTDLAMSANILSDAIRQINEKIPDGAGAGNQLVDEETLQKKVLDLIPEDTDYLTNNILTNKAIVENAIYKFADVLEPIGTIKSVIGSYDTEHWHICDGTDGTPNLTGRVLEQAGDTKTITIINQPKTYNEVALKSNVWYSFTRDLIQDTYTEYAVKGTTWYSVNRTVDPYVYTAIATPTGTVNEELSTVAETTSDGYTIYSTVVFEHYDNYVFSTLDPAPTADSYSFNSSQSSTSFTQNGYTCYEYATFTKADSTITETTDVGDTIEAGLPNITGQSNIMVVSDYTSGALRTWRSGTEDGNAGSTRAHQGYQDFNASRSSNIYGRSSTVQPKAYAVNFIIKIKNYYGE